MKFTLLAAVAAATTTPAATPAAATGAALGEACDAGLDKKGCATGHKCATAGGTAKVVTPTTTPWAFVKDSPAATTDLSPGSATAAGTNTVQGKACGKVVTSSTVWAADPANAGAFIAGTATYRVKGESADLAAADMKTCPAAESSTVVADVGSTVAGAMSQAKDALKALTGGDVKTPQPGICVAEASCGKPNTATPPVDVVCSATKLGAGILATLAVAASL